MPFTVYARRALGGIGGGATSYRGDGSWNGRLRELSPRTTDIDDGSDASVV